jgi:hypothetical protein
MVSIWRHALIAGVYFTLSNCASVSILPLNPNGTVDTTQAPGLRYYMPKPYLLVTVIPPPPQKPTDPRLLRAPPAPAPPPPPGPGGGPDDGSQKAAPTGSPSPSSDLSYQLGSSTYLLKLIYLPDMSKTMAINLTPSILGTSSVQPTLQDGWMLTSLQASADNTKALDDMTTLASAILGGGTKAASSTSSKTAKADLLGPGTPPPPDNLPPPLPPGLYEFGYDGLGHLYGLCPVSLFQSNGIVNNGPNCVALANIRAARPRPVFLK